ncbi:glycosyl hydrolase family 17 protein, partial [Vibrio vulnificus]|uniref:glycosyl hydrolase family 17 protein n=1 Tax=Vibrio vulnificus TaxID=672 RepID=UPI0039B6E521
MLDGLPNEQLLAAASRPSYALAWVRRNVAAYYPATQIQGIAVGNEVFASAKKHTVLTPLCLSQVSGQKVIGRQLW